MERVLFRAGQLPGHEWSRCVKKKEIKDVVAAGYNIACTAYNATRDSTREADYRAWLKPICREMAPGAHVLDLGCGCGVPASRILAERFAVTGVDISPVQIGQAQSLVPHAKFVVGDMTSVSFESATFDAVVSLYAIIHVPLDEQFPLIQSIYRWLLEAGMAVLIVGSRAWTGTEKNWLGVKGATMFWSHADAGTYRDWFERVGFTIVEETFVPDPLIEGRGGHQKFLLKKLAPAIEGEYSK
jgi:ubiquinone/menaquinone biosynthesis C-methylase UbiE